jgi:hypothetical protein
MFWMTDVGNGKAEMVCHAGRSKYLKNVKYRKRQKRTVIGFKMKKGTFFRNNKKDTLFLKTKLVNEAVGGSIRGATVKT